MDDRLCRILLVEDNPAEVRLFKEALYEGSMPHSLYVAADGCEALDVLYRRHNHKAKLLPDLILLDINLPKCDGHEVLAIIKQDPALWAIPVLMLTSSDASADISRAYQHHANAYIQKPSELDAYLDMVQRIERFWLGTVALPTP